MAVLSRHNGQVQDASGNTVAGVKIEVRRDVSGLPLASLFSDRDGLAALSNPFNVSDVNPDDDGSYFFHAVGGAYRVRAFTGDSLSPTFEDIERYVAIGTNSETDFGTGFLPRGAWSGATTYSIGDLVSHNDGVGDNFAFVSNIADNLDNEPTFDGSNVGQSDADWSVLGLIESPGTPGSSNVNATSATSNTISTGSKSFTTAEIGRGWGVGARLRATSSATPASDFMEGVVTAYDGANALTVLMDTVPSAANAGPHTDWVINLAGSRGLAGSDPGVFLDWDDGTTDADPGTGNIRADNADLSAATQLFISKTDANGNDISTFLATIDESTNTTRKGSLIIRRSSDNTIATIDYGDLTDATGYVKLDIVASSHSGATALVDGDAVSFQPSRDGNKGFDGIGAGDVIGPDSATDNAVARWDTASGALLQNSSVVIDDSGNLTGVSALTMSGSLTMSGNVTGVTDLTMSGDLTGVDDLSMSGSVTSIMKFSEGADVASATAVTLGDDGNFFTLTGTTDVESIATKGIGTIVKIAFADTLTLVHSTDLVMPGNTDLTVRAGDEFELREHEAGKWTLINHQTTLDHPRNPRVRYQNDTVSILKSDHGSIVSVGGGAPTVTLPLISTVFTGFEVTIVANTSGTLTIVRSGSDTIRGGSSTTITNIYGSKTFRATTGVWFVIGAS